MRFKTMALLSASLFTLGCAHREMGARAMVADIYDTKSARSAVINILWYKGSDVKFDYFAYVYSMTGTRFYQVPSSQFVMHRVPLIKDGSKWIGIRAIDGLWTSSYKNSDGVWEEDQRGIEIQIVENDTAMKPQ